MTIFKNLDIKIEIVEAFETKYGKTKYQLILNEMEKKSKNQIVVFVVDFD